MGIFGGIVDVAKNVVSGATAPLRGAAKIVGTGLETAGKVGLDVLTLQPGKALDDLSAGLHEQVDNVVGIPKDQWNAVKGAAGGLGETVTSGARFLGEPVRGVARVAANNLATVGEAGGQALTGDLSGAAGTVVDGARENLSIGAETVSNQVNNLF